MTRTILIASLFLLFSCSQDSNIVQTSQGDTLKKAPKAPGTQMTEEFRDIDTLINLTLYDLKPFDNAADNMQKKRIVIAALKSAMPDFAYRYLEESCWRLDPKTKEPYEDTTTSAPDCRLNEFYLIDLDEDGDLDVVYSSSIDQYAHGDTNYLLLLQNNNGSYKRYDIGGFLYDADFSKLSSGTIIFKNASRPCCEYMNYNFSETTFNTKTWVMVTKHVLEIHKSKVHEQ
jgi:hypothetical protein